jgi:hypothetical protein
MGRGIALPVVIHMILALDICVYSTFKGARILLSMCFVCVLYACFVRNYLV